MEENTEKCGCACDAQTETVGRVELPNQAMYERMAQAAEVMAQFEREEELRIRFACAALTGLLASGHYTNSQGEYVDGQWVEHDEYPEVITTHVCGEDGEITGRREILVAESAYMVADAMLAEHKNRSK